MYFFIYFFRSRSSYLLHEEVLFASAVADTATMHLSVHRCLTWFFSSNLDSDCMCAAYFTFLSMMDFFFPLLLLPLLLTTVTVHHFVPTINHYQFSNLFLQLSLHITYIHIDTCVRCEITLRVYECVYTRPLSLALSKGNERERIIGKKERHYMHTPMH